MSLFPKACRTRVRSVQVGVAGLAAALIAGCGSAYRPVVTPINPNGPPAQPQSLAVTISSPSPTSLGIATVIDYAGDTVMATAPVGLAPLAFTVDATGSNGYTLNSDGTLTNFPVSTSLQLKNEGYSTLPATAQPVQLFTPNAGIWAADLNGNTADVLVGVPGVLKLSIPIAATPITIVGASSISQRNYSISLNNSSTPAGSAMTYQDMTCNTSPSSATQTGEADALEVSTYTVSARIPLGKCPVYAVESSESRRLFVLNRGSNTVSVINTQNNALDQCTPFLGQNNQWVTCHPTIPLPAGPVYAEYNAATQQLIVANYDANSISIIDVTMDEYGNDHNTYANPDCTVGGVTSYANCGAITGGFGTTYTVPVGPNPASVTVLADGSRAYTANQADGTVTIVNVPSHSVEKTLAVTGSPRTVVSTQNSLFGKVYVASPDSPYLTIIRTDQDIVDTTILVEGNIVDVRVTSQSTTGGNNNNTSRRPGGGQPCYLPGAAGTASFSACTTLP
jgi:DNA-binding beta-propeller fold protein YncE